MGAGQILKGAVAAALVRVVLSGLLLVSLTAAAHARGLAQAEPAFVVSLPLVTDNLRLAEIQVETRMTGLVKVPPAALADALGERINSEGAAALRALGGALTDVGAVRGLGFDIRLNTQTLAVELEIPAPFRAARTYSLGGSVRDARGDAVDVSRNALGVTGALLITDTLSDAEAPAAEFSFDGFLHRGGRGGVSVDFGGRYRLRSTGETDFQRDRIFAFTDRVEAARRYGAGEASTDLFRDIGLLDVLGISAEQSYQTLQPTRNVRPTGARSLVLERRSTVEVFVNGALVKRFVADAGPLDLRDIPLANISNDVTILVEDALGRREIDSFALSADVSMLADGLSEWAFSAGFAREQLSEALSYDFDQPIAGVRYTRGVRSGLTLGGSAAATPEMSALGAAAAFAGFNGVTQLDVTLSQSEGPGGGFAAGLNYSGGPFFQGARPVTLNVRANYLSADFATLNDPGSLSSSRWSIGADARMTVTARTSMTLSAVFQDDHVNPAQSTTVSAGLSRRFGEIIVSANARWSDFSDQGSQTGVFFTLSRRLGSRQQITASYDSLADTGRLDWRRSRLPGSPNLAAQASLVQTGDVREISGSVAGETARAAAELDASYRPGANGLRERSAVALRLQSGVAMADGSWGIGRDPGRGFALIDRHASLDGAEILVSVGAGERPAARADRFGPAVLPLTAAYRPQDLRIGARNLEPGYSIGAGVYTVLPGALNGVRIQIGNAAYRTAVATLIGDGGAPAALRFGRLLNLETGEETSIFTNRSGRAAFNALAPGRYQARLQGGGVFSFEIAEDAPAYVNMGVLNAGSLDG